MNSLDENTKLFQKYLETTAPKPEKLNAKNSFPRVQGGLPPHLLNAREDAPKQTPPDTPKATVSAFIRTLFLFVKMLTWRRCLAVLLSRMLPVAYPASLLGHRRHS